MWRKNLFYKYLVEYFFELPSVLTMLNNFFSSLSFFFKFLDG